MKYRQLADTGVFVSELCLEKGFATLDVLTTIARSRDVTVPQIAPFASFAFSAVKP